MFIVYLLFVLKLMFCLFIGCGDSWCGDYCGVGRFCLCLFGIGFAVAAYFAFWFGRCLLPYYDLLVIWFGFVGVLFACLFMLCTALEL